MTKIKVLELMDAIQQTQKNADDMWRVLREIMEQQRNAQQSVHLTGGGLCACCGSPKWAHSVIGHVFIPTTRQ